MKESKPFELTLNDCLACSGCITNEEEAMLKRFELKKLIEEDNTKKTFVISPYSKMKIYKSRYAAEGFSFTAFESSLVHFLKNLCSAIDVIDSSSAQSIVLESVSNEFFNGTSPLITSDCSGTVAYIERKGGHLIRALSKTLTPQQVCVENARKRGGIVSVVPCYDKKLENGRDGCKVDYVLSTEEFCDFLEAKGFCIGNTDEVSMKEKTRVFNRSLSGGYTEFLMNKMKILTKSVEKLNKNYWVYRFESGKRMYIFHKVYGIKNVLNLINKTKRAIDFDFAEVFLCEGACAGGPLLKDEESLVEMKHLYESFEAVSEKIEVDGSLQKRQFCVFTAKKVHFNVEW